jgi:hypothetical protein
VGGRHDARAVSGPGRNRCDEAGRQERDACEDENRAGRPPSRSTASMTSGIKLGHAH